MYGQPAPNQRIVTPSDSADLAVTANYLLVEHPTAGTTVTIKLTDEQGVSSVHYVPAGQYYWGRVTRVWAASLTASAQVTAFY